MVLRKKKKNCSLYVPLFEWKISKGVNVIGHKGQGEIRGRVSHDMFTQLYFADVTLIVIGFSTLLYVVHL